MNLLLDRQISQFMRQCRDTEPRSCGRLRRPHRAKWQPDARHRVVRQVGQQIPDPSSGWCVWRQNPTDLHKRVKAQVPGIPYCFQDRTVPTSVYPVAQKCSYLTKLGCFDCCVQVACDQIALLSIQLSKLFDGSMQAFYEKWLDSIRFNMFICNIPFQ